MSWTVESWVWKRCHVIDHLQRNVLLAIAWHAVDDGTTSNGPSFDVLAEMVRHDRKRVMAAVGALEAAAELLVWRSPLVRKGPRSPNCYAVVMGRDPAALRREVEEARHRPRFMPPVAGTDQHVVTERRPHPAAPPARPRSTLGPSSVRSRSSSERAGGLGLGLSPGRASASRSSPARARPPDSRLDPLRAELDGIVVSWDMTDEQAQAMAALLEVHGARRLATVALEQVTARGRPTFARAWLGEWRKLPVPGEPLRTEHVPPPRQATTWCRSCDDKDYRWVVDESGAPLYPCPRCHPSANQVSVPY